MRDIEAEAKTVAEEFFKRFDNTENTDAKQNDRNIFTVNRTRVDREVQAYRKLLKTGIVDDLLAM